MRLVLDSSVLIAAVRPEEPEHEHARGFVERLRAGIEAGAVTALAPAELWLEVHVVERRLAASRRGGPGGPAVGSAMGGLAIALVTAAGEEDLDAFLEHLDKRMRGRRPFSNATDLAYLWVAWSVGGGAMVVTLDEGMLGYHGVVCDVTRPQHVRMG
jgi:predicted nucleic acid-binding protein